MGGSRPLWPLLSIALAVAPAHALIVVAEVETPWPATRIAVVEDRAYVIDRDVRILDVSEPLAPEPLGAFGVVAGRVHVAEPLAFAWGTTTGVAIVDVSDPEAPVPLARVLAGQQVADVALDGDVLHVSARTTQYLAPWRWVVFDVSDPAHPTLLADLLLSPPISEFEFAVSSPLLFTCGRELRIFGVHDPTAPVALSLQALPHECRSLRVEGDLAYLLHREALLIFDVADASQPHLLASLPLGEGFELEVSGDAAYVLGDHGLTRIDVSDPAAPEVLGTNGIYGGDLAVRGRHVLVAAQRGVIVVDVSHPGGPVELGSDRASGTTGGLAHRGDRVYALGSVSLNVVDVSDYSDVRVLGRRGAGSGSSGLDLEGPIAAVASDVGVRLLDVTNETLPAQLGAYQPGRDIWARDIDLQGTQGTLAYTTTTRGLEVLDVSDPFALEPIALLPLDISPVPIVVDGSLAFIAGGPATLGGSSGFRVVDVSRPTDPLLIGALPLPYVGTRLACSRQRAYVVTGKTGLRILDVSDPAAPADLGSLPAVSQVLTSTTRDVAVSGRFAYVAEGDYGVRVVDVHDPANPLELGSRQAVPGTLTRVQTLDARHGIAFVGDSADYVRIIDFRDLLSGGGEVEMRLVWTHERPRPVAFVEIVVFGSESFAAREVDGRSLGLGADDAAPFPHGRVRFRDTDRDGHQDLIAWFRLSGAGAQEVEGEMCLAGRLRTGRVFELCDTPRAPRPPRRGKR
jgi:hypothetical protein